MHNLRIWLMKFLLAVIRIPSSVEDGTLILNPKDVKSAKLLRFWLTNPWRLSGLHFTMLFLGSIGGAMLLLPPAIHETVWQIVLKKSIGATVFCGAISPIWLRLAIKSLVSSDVLCSQEWDHQSSLRNEIVRPTAAPTFILDGVSYYRRSDVEAASLLRASSVEDQSNEHLLHPVQNAADSAVDQLLIPSRIIKTMDETSVELYSLPDNPEIVLKQTIGSSEVPK